MHSFARSTLHPGSAGVIICWKDHFVQVGDFDEGLEVRENSELMKRLKRFGKYRYISDVAATTSMRRYEQCGVQRVLWLWCTNAFMREAYQCLDAWSFKEKTILTWDKEKIGLGDWLRNVTEHCIMAVRGHPVVSLTNQTTIIREKRREHSRKPEAFYSLVEALCPGSKLEMFARQSRRGWASWGAESEKFGAEAAE